MIKLVSYSVASLANITILGVLISQKISILYKTFLYLTILSYTFSSFYLLAMCVYEALFFYHKENEGKVTALKSSNFYNTLRDRIFKYTFTISITVCIGYWSLCLGGSDVMPLKLEDHLWFNVYVHLVIGLQILAEFILTERKHHPQLYRKDLLIFFIVYLLYSFFLTIIAKSCDLYIYPFLKLYIHQIIGVYLILLVISFNIYQAYDYLLARKNKNKITTDDGKMETLV